MADPKTSRSGDFCPHRFSKFLSAHCTRPISRLYSIFFAPQGSQNHKHVRVLKRSQAKCCDFGVRITAQITLSAPTLVPGAQPQITVFAGQLAANHSFFQDKSQNGGAKSQFRSHFLAGGRLDLSWNHTSHPTLVLLDPECFRAQYPLLFGCS